MLTFVAAVFFLLITPGPGVLSTAGIGSAFGGASGVRYVGGLFVGSNMVALAVVSGLTAALFADDRLRTVLFALSVMYLFYLAVRIAFAGSRIAFIERASPPSFVDGVLLQVINPKAYVVGATLFGGFSFWPEFLLAEISLKFLILNAIWVPVHFLWLWAGIRLGQLDLPRKTHIAINVGMALSMLAVVGLATLSQF